MDFCNIDFEMTKGILEFCLQARKIADLQARFGYSDRTYFRNNHIQPLLEDGMLEMTIPDKPTSAMVGMHRFA